MPWRLPDGRTVSAEMQFTLGEGESAITFTPGAIKFETAESLAMDYGIVWEDPAPEPPPPRYVPSSVTPLQARRALSAAGLRDQVEALIAASPIEVRDAWDWGLSVDRHSPFIEGLGGQLGLTSEQIDDLFVAAAQL